MLVQTKRMGTREEKREGRRERERKRKQKDGDIASDRESEGGERWR